MSLLPGGEVSQTPGAAMASSRDVTWRIEGITCMKCVRLITEASGIRGITEVLVSKELLTRFTEFMPTGLLHGLLLGKDLSWFISSVIPDNLSEENKNCLVVLGVNKFLESSCKPVAITPAPPAWQNTTTCSQGSWQPIITLQSRAGRRSF